LGRSSVVCGENFFLPIFAGESGISDNFLLRLLFSAAGKVIARVSAISIFIINRRIRDFLESHIFPA
jgi:hypothetical protein